MRVTLRILGLEVFAFEASTDAEACDETDPDRDASGGTLGSTPMGFTPQWGDQRWEQGPDLGE